MIYWLFSCVLSMVSSSVNFKENWIPSCVMFL